MRRLRILQALRKKEFELANASGNEVAKQSSAPSLDNEGTSAAKGADGEHAGASALRAAASSEDRVPSSAASAELNEQQAADKDRDTDKGREIFPFTLSSPVVGYGPATPPAAAAAAPPAKVDSVPKWARDMGLALGDEVMCSAKGTRTCGTTSVAKC